VRVLNLTDMRRHFQHYVRTDLQELGFTAEEAEHAFVFPPVQLRKVLPPDTILRAVTDKLAAEQEFEKQKTVTATAVEIARRRTREGQGIANLFSNLPKGFSPNQIAVILNAMATKQQADGIEKAVNMGEAKLFVVGTNNPLSVNTGP
jgi:hypothetical protein